MDETTTKMMQFLLTRSIVQQGAIEMLLALHAKQNGPEQAEAMFAVLRSLAEDIGAKGNLSEPVADLVTEAKLQRVPLTESLIDQVKTFWDGRPER